MTFRLVFIKNRLSQTIGGIWKPNTLPRPENSDTHNIRSINGHTGNLCIYTATEGNGDTFAASASQTLTTINMLRHEERRKEREHRTAESKPNAKQRKQKPYTHTCTHTHTRAHIQQKGAQHERERAKKVPDTPANQTNKHLYIKDIQHNSIAIRKRSGEKTEMENCERDAEIGG